MKLTLILLVILLTSCGGPTPTPSGVPSGQAADYPIPGEPEVITVGDITFEMPTPAPTPTVNIIAAWVRYDPCGNDVQELGIELIDIDGGAMSNQIVDVCMDSQCTRVTTDEYGEAIIQFSRTWGIGSVPYSVCLGELCLRSSFMGE